MPLLGAELLETQSRGFFFFLIKLLFAALVLVAACRLSLVARSRGYPLVEVFRLLMAVVSLVVEHGL